MVSKQERERARRRYEKYQARVAEREAAAGRRRRWIAVATAGAVVAVAVAVAIVVFVGRDDPVSVIADPAAVPSGDAVAPSADLSAAPVANPCPATGPPPRTDALTFPAVSEPVDGRFTVTLATTCGDISMDLDGSVAPQAVGNMVFLAREGFFDATPCHRLTTSSIFVLQCGDPTGTGTGGPGFDWGPIENAPDDDVYPAGTVAMARRSGDAGSMGSQFFLVYQDSTIPSDEAGGYTVMGSITEGLDIVQQVAAGGLGADGTAPAISIGIQSVSVEEAS